MEELYLPARNTVGYTMGKSRANASGRFLGWLALQIQLSLAEYCQYPPSPSVQDIPAGTVAPGPTNPLPYRTHEFVGTAGSSRVTRAQLTIKDSGGIRVGIGVSWSNNTGLLQGQQSRRTAGHPLQFPVAGWLVRGSNSN
jgi:hypothetical protein